MIKKLLVAIDGSNHSIKAVDFASELATSLKAEVILLSVVKSHELPKKLSIEIRDYAEIEHIDGLNANIWKKIAHSLVEEAQNKVSMSDVVKVTTEVKEGPVARTIIARARHHKADMIVIGSRGMGNIEATLRGGVSHRVELLANCPVLTVR